MICGEMAQNSSALDYYENTPKSQYLAVLAIVFLDATRYSELENVP